MGIENKDLRILIVEDEPIIAYSTQDMLQQMGFQQFQIVHTKADALRAIESKKNNIAILDINLGEGEEGIDLAKSCSNNNIPFFYITSYGDKETLDKALKTTPGAYLIKPFLYPSLYSAVNITLQHIKEKTHFSFKHKGKYLKIPIKDIIYLKADDIYIDIVTANRTYLYRSSLKKILLRLPKEQFIYSHRAYVVNLTHVLNLTQETVEIANTSLPLSRTFRNNLKEHFLSNRVN